MLLVLLLLLGAIFLVVEFHSRELRHESTGNALIVGGSGDAAVILSSVSIDSCCSCCSSALVRVVDEVRKSTYFVSGSRDRGTLVVLVLVLAVILVLGLDQAAGHLKKGHIGPHAIQRLLALQELVDLASDGAVVLRICWDKID